MRKVVLIWIVVAVVVVGLIYYFLPRQIQMEAPGIKYRLGVENQGTVKPVYVHIKGALYRGWLGNRTFRGTLGIEGEELPVSEVNRELEIQLDKNNFGWLHYYNVQDEFLGLYLYGTVTFAKDYSKVTFNIHEKDSDYSSQWNGEDGLMLSAPASNREEALQISNELMGRYNNGERFQ